MAKAEYLSLGEPHYIWHPEVHRFAGETLRYYFLRAPLGTGVYDQLRDIVEYGDYPMSAHELLGFYGFVVRVWAREEEHEGIEKRLLDFVRSRGGQCLPIEVRDVVYRKILISELRPNSARRRARPESSPTPEKIAALFAALRDLPAETDRTEYIRTHKAALQRDGLMLSSREQLQRARKNHAFKAYTVIRTLQIGSQKWFSSLINEWMNNGGRNQDMTRYDTIGEMDFIIRWNHRTVEDLNRAVHALSDHIAKTGEMYAHFETYLALSSGQLEKNHRDNFRVSRTPTSGEQTKLSAFLPIGTATTIRREMVLESGLQEKDLKSNKYLTDFVNAFLVTDDNDQNAGNTHQDTISLLRVFRDFEMALRRHWLTTWWDPAAQAGATENILKELSQILGKREVEIGREGQRAVPKLTLGELGKIVIVQLPEVGLRHEDLQPIVQSRNMLTHQSRNVHPAEFNDYVERIRVIDRVVKNIDSITHESKRNGQGDE